MKKDEVLARQIFKHLAFGYTDPAFALELIESLQAGSASLTPEQQKRRILFSVGLLRQSLLVIPFYESLREQLALFNKTFPPQPRYASWYAATGKIMSALGIKNCLEGLRQAQEVQCTAEELLERIVADDNPVLRFAFMLRLWEYGSWEAFSLALEKWLNAPSAPVASDLFAMAALSAGDMEMAERCLAVSIDGPITRLARGRMLRMNGDTAGAATFFNDCLAAEPAQLHIIRMLAEISAPLPSRRAMQKNIGIGFYTWNKFEVTLDTLKSLLASDHGQAKIALINNGSDKFRPEDFEAAVKNIAQGYPVELINLPVNIGAPAARNWLWRLPSMAEVEYFAFLDDDVLLPSDWLVHYCQDLEENAQACVVGPKGLNYGSLPGIQYIPRLFEKAGPEGIRFTHNAPLIMDLSQFDYRRPSLSVMGCCHLFNRRKCREIGLPDFDLRFSPSQVDDIEHDLQIWKLGGQVMFDGRVGVIHRQDSGKAAMDNAGDRGHVWGNHYKMERKLAPDLIKIEKNMLKAETESFAAALAVTADSIAPPAREFATMCLDVMQEFCA